MPENTLWKKRRFAGSIISLILIVSIISAGIPAAAHPDPDPVAISSAELVEQPILVSGAIRAEGSITRSTDVPGLATEHVSTSQKLGDIFKKPPYLLATGNPGSMTIRFQGLDTPADCSVTYKKSGTAGFLVAPCPRKGRVLDETDDHYVSLTLQNLSPGSLYEYTVSLDYGKNAKICSGTADGKFVASPEPAAGTVTFYGIGDTGIVRLITDNDFHEVLMGSLLADISEDKSHRMTLIAHVGDIVDEGNHKEKGNPWDRFVFNYDTYPNQSRVMRNIPVVAAVGNHDFYPDNFMNYDLVEGNNLPYMIAKRGPYIMGNKIYPFEMYPVKDRLMADYFQSFDYGPVHFIYLDPYPMMDNQYGIPCDTPSANTDSEKPQYQWLEQDLRNTTKKHIVVVLHNPVYNPDFLCNHPFYAAKCKDYCTSDGDPAMQKYLVPLFKKYGVDLVLQGHTHQYVREIHDDITYVTLGSGGSQIEPVSDKIIKDNHVKKYDSVYCFTRFEVDGNAIGATVIDENGAVVDRYIISTRAGVRIPGNN